MDSDKTSTEGEIVLTFRPSLEPQITEFMHEIIEWLIAKLEKSKPEPQKE